MKPHRQRIRHRHVVAVAERAMRAWFQDIGPATCRMYGQPWVRGRSREARRRFAWARWQKMRKGPQRFTVVCGTGTFVPTEVEV